MEIVVFKLDERYFGIALKHIVEFIVLKSLKGRNGLPGWVDGSISYKGEKLPFLSVWKGLKLSPPEREVGIVTKSNTSKIIFGIPKVIGLYDLDIKEEFGVPIAKYFEGAVVFKDKPLIIINPIKLYGKRIEKLKRQPLTYGQIAVGKK